MKTLVCLSFMLGLGPGFMFIELDAQPVFTPWGNVNGIYIDGEKMEFESSLRAVTPDWKGYVQTEKYNWEGEQTYTIQGKTHTVAHELLGLPVAFTTAMTETAMSSAHVDIKVEIMDELKLAGLYYCVEVPGAIFSAGTISFFKDDKNVSILSLSGLKKSEQGELARVKASKMIIHSDKREFIISTKNTVEIILRSDFISQPAYLNDPSPRQIFTDHDPNLTLANYQIYFTILKDSPKKGRKANMVFDIKASGTIDKEPIEIVMDVTKPGRPFDGIGGNFRLQFPDKDPAVIQYCLNNLNVVWARVPFYWDEWQPEAGMDPVKLAQSGQLSERFEKQMQLAVELAKRKMPVIFSVWWPPAWAVDQDKKVPKGLVLDNDRIQEISKSIASFFVYVKQTYGIEADYFSFNESDYGVEVFQTPEDHAFQLKAIGECLASNGLKTKVLIGDTGAGTAKANKIMSIIEKDPGLHKYAGAVSFHTYHGVTTPDLMAWAQSAAATNLPIMVAEGGSNSAAHRYPLIFLQPWFQLDEIDKYIRICALCQPVTILEWQLTADYSVLTGMGLYGDNGPLRPTQRFWNLKQLGLTPKGSFAVPVRCNRPNISCAAFGDVLNAVYTLHIVNNGAARQVTIKGLPAGVEALQLYITDAEKGMEKAEKILVRERSASFVLAASAYTTLINDPVKQ